MARIEVILDRELRYILLKFSVNLREYSGSSGEIRNNLREILGSILEKS